MARLEPADMGDEDEVICSYCNAVFTIIWRYSAETMLGVEYCPFCGDEIERE